MPTRAVCFAALSILSHGQHRRSSSLVDVGATTKYLEDDVSDASEPARYLHLEPLAPEPRDRLYLVYR